MQITHITKDDFFTAFSKALKASLTPRNIQTDFRAIGLIPHNHGSVLARPDSKPVKPSLPISYSGTPNFWVTKTPQTSHKINLQYADEKDEKFKFKDSPTT
ncbi:hypothetical protein GcC1_025043 [Golovinomyces cichoracearum]|uniref:Uncharacterized protein n=1 Tax=Golovinomyces cichoracearum TaxID=62708 RepID=A0A420J3U4_9PEZI|nr:hypothetical protein GcC1_025043 [Golovinomyces cichoracearum]